MPGFHGKFNQRGLTDNQLFKNGIDKRGLTVFKISEGRKRGLPSIFLIIKKKAHNKSIFLIKMNTSHFTLKYLSYKNSYSMLLMSTLLKARLDGTATTAEAAGVALEAVAVAAAPE